jgi:hypothetical protein
MVVDRRVQRQVDLVDQVAAAEMVEVVVQQHLDKELLAVLALELPLAVAVAAVVLVVPEIMEAQMELVVLVV